MSLIIPQKLRDLVNPGVYYALLNKQAVPFCFEQKQDCRIIAQALQEMMQALAAHEKAWLFEESEIHYPSCWPSTIAIARWPKIP